MARLLLEDVTLRRCEDITVQVRFKGGATHQMQVPLPQSVTVTRKSKLELIAEIDRLLNEHSEGEVAQLLNERGWRSSTGQPFSLTLIQGLRRTYRLKSRFARLQEQGLLTARQIEDMLGPGTNRAKYWRKAGLLKVVRLNQHYKHLYHRPSRTELSNSVRWVAPPPFVRDAKFFARLNPSWPESWITPGFSRRQFSRSPKILLFALASL